MYGHIPVAQAPGRLSLADAPLSLRWWHWYGAVVLAITVAFVAASDRPADRVVGCLAVLTRLALSYATVGHRLVGRGPGSRAAPAYQILVFVLFAAADALVPNAGNLMWVLCPLSYLLLPFGWAVFVVALFNLVLVAGQALREHDLLAALRGQGPLAAGAFAFSLVFAAWINRIVTQNHDRAMLID